MATHSPAAITEQFRQYLKKEGLSFTPQRMAIAEFIINKKNHHFSTEELVTELRTHGNPVSRATVYRTISHLHQAGFLREVALDSTQAYYDIVVNVRHHEHLVCEQCGKIIEFTDPDLEKTIEAVSRRNNIKMTRHTVQIFGLCPECQRRHQTRSETYETCTTGGTR